MRRQSRCWAALPSSTASVTVPMMAMLVHPRDSLFHSSPGQQAAPHAPSSSSTSPLPDVKGAFAASVSSPAQHLVPVSHHSSGSGCFSCELESPTQPARTTVTVCTEVMSPAPGGAWSPLVSLRNGSVPASWEGCILQGSAISLIPPAPTTGPFTSAAFLGLLLADDRQCGPMATPAPLMTPDFKGQLCISEPPLAPHFVIS